MALKALAEEQLEVDEWVARGSVDYNAYRERRLRASKKKKAPAGAIRAFPAGSSKIRAPSPMVESRSGSQVPSASAKSSRAPSVAAKSQGPSRAPSQSGSVPVARAPNVAGQEEAKDGESSGTDEFGGFGDDVMEYAEANKDATEVDKDVPMVDKDEPEGAEDEPQVDKHGPQVDMHEPEVSGGAPEAPHPVGPSPPTAMDVDEEIQEVAGPAAADEEPDEDEVLAAKRRAQTDASVPLADPPCVACSKGVDWVCRAHPKSTCALCKVRKVKCSFTPSTAKPGTRATK